MNTGLPGAEGGDIHVGDAVAVFAQGRLGDDGRCKAQSRVAG